MCVCPCVRACVRARVCLCCSSPPLSLSLFLSLCVSVYRVCLAGQCGARSHVGQTRISSGGLDDVAILHHTLTLVPPAAATSLSLSVGVLHMLLPMLKSSCFIRTFLLFRLRALFRSIVVGSSPRASLLLPCTDRRRGS